MWSLSPRNVLQFNYAIITIKLVLMCFDIQGGFARVYEVTDMSTNKVYALKAVPKVKLSKSADRYNKVSVTV